MDYIKFLTPLIAEIEKLLKSLGAAGKPYFQQHIESLLKTTPKTVVNRQPKKEGEQPEIMYVAAFNWLSYPLNSNLDLFTEGRPPNKYELSDLAFFRLAVLYDGFHQRPGRDKIYFDLLNPPDDLAHNIAIGYWDEVKRLVEKEGRKGEVEAVFNQDLRLVEDNCKDDEDDNGDLPSPPWAEEIDNPEEIAQDMRNRLNNLCVKIIQSTLDDQTKNDLKRQANTLINRLDKWMEITPPDSGHGLTDIIRDCMSISARFNEEADLASTKLSETKQDATPAKGNEEEYEREIGYSTMETFKELHDLIYSQLESPSGLDIREAPLAAVRIRRKFLENNPTLDMPNVPTDNDPNNPMGYYTKLMDYCTDAQRVVDAASLPNDDLASTKLNESQPAKGAKYWFKFVCKVIGGIGILLGILWTAIQIYESATFKQFVASQHKSQSVYDPNAQTKSNDITLSSKTNYDTSNSLSDSNLSPPESPNQ